MVLRLQRVLNEMTVNEGQIIYGIKVKGTAKTLKEMLDSDEIHAIKESNRKDDSNSVIYKDIPDNWVEGDSKQ
ncbi:hypothetical protein [Desmospora activa]|uniref:Uncharacterized protein n=1 Tax=Desmospora activa DSM 45169 TaxID=1121389 RepID=A0A2T4Z928_9BACL|nr:hypothetical protein [Desmospora activa]PTM58396.1 hypothetical protein C8J48_0979 [Desmospora activa DSM 45169]